MARKLLLKEEEGYDYGNLTCCKPEGDITNTDYLSTRSGSATKVKDIILQEDGNYFKEDDTIGKAIGTLRAGKTPKGAPRAEDLCLIYNTLVYLATKTKKWTINNYQAEYDELFETLKALCGDNTPKPKKCKDEKGRKACEKKKKDGENVTWDSKTCKCVDVTKKKEDVDPIFGCGDDTASNYYCNQPDNKCKNGKLPEGFVSTGCVWKRDDILLVNQYCFCTSSICADGGNCIRPGTYTVSGTSKEFYERVFTRAYNHVNSIAIGTKFSDEIGFYAENATEEYEALKVDLATVLSILHLRHYSLARKNNTYLVVYTPNGKELGFFKNVRREDKMFSTIDDSTTKGVYKKRFSNCPGCSVPEHQIDWFVENFVDKVNQDGIIVSENNTKLGLGSLLINEPKGLERLLNKRK